MSQRAKYSACKHLLSRKKYDVDFPGYRRSKKSVKHDIKFNRSRKDKEEMNEVSNAPNLTIPERVAVDALAHDLSDPSSRVQYFLGSAQDMKNVVSAYTKAGILAPLDFTFAAKRGMTLEAYSKHLKSTMTPKQRNVHRMTPSIYNS